MGLGAGFLRFAGGPGGGLGARCLKVRFAIDRLRSSICAASGGLKGRHLRLGGFGSLYAIGLIGAIGGKFNVGYGNIVSVLHL